MLGLKSWLPSVHCIFCMLISALSTLHRRWKKHHHVVIFVNAFSILGKITTALH